MTSQSVVIATAAAVTLGIAGYVAYRVLSARRVSRETDRIASALALQPVSHIADVGAGNGAYSIEMAARIVPRGRVFATEVDEKAVEALRRKAASAGLSNVVPTRADEASTNLPEECCDAIFLRGVYHHLTRPLEVGAGLHAALRSSGRLAILDFAPSWLLSTFLPVRGVPANRGGHGVPAAVVIAELEQAGFRLIDRSDDWEGDHYCLVFQRAATNSGGPV